MFKKLHLGAILLLYTGVGMVQAQSSLKSPEEFLGYALGTAFSRHEQIQGYFRYVAEQTDRVRLVSYGQSNERRPLYYMIVTAPENMARIEEIRTNNLKVAGLMPGSSTGFEKPIVWMSYNVHGNEPASSEAAMGTLYALLQPQSPKINEWLDKTVVIIDPCLNPDGRDRYVNWYNAVAGKRFNPLREAREHVEPWPGGRSNHYMFDLNRDWSWLTQQETQQRISVYNEWMPHVHADYHEQGIDEPYYFPPAAEPYHAVITPWQREFQMQIGRNNAKYFDEKGWMYFTRERFDLFYPAYGDTYPVYNGSIGMTYEQGGIGGGLGVFTAEGDTLTFVQRVQTHITTSLSNIEVSAREAGRLISEYRKFFQQTPNYPYKSYVLRGNKGSLRALQQHLDGLGIRYGLAPTSKVYKGFNFRKNTDEPISVKMGDLVVSVFQPKSVLTHVLFEPKSTLPDSVTYDITAWSLPYAYNLEAYALPDRIDPIASDPLSSGQAVFEPALAYITTWNNLQDAKFLSALLQKGYKVRFSIRPITHKGVTYAPGSLIIARHLNDRISKPFGKEVSEVAHMFGKELIPLSTGMADAGPDLGSGDVFAIKTPRVAMLTGNALSSLSAGEVWHFFDNDLSYPVTQIQADDLGRANLAQYDVLVLPNGGYGSILNESNLNKVREWIRSGGRLIAIEGAMSFLAGKDGFRLKTKTEESGKKNAGEEDLSRRLRPYIKAERESMGDAIPGAIFRLKMDHTHPLAFGYDETYFELKQDNTLYEYLTDGDNVGVVPKNSWVTGFVGHRLKPKLQEVLAYGVVDMGRGQVVYMAENPLFRGFWYGGKLLFANAIFMVGQR
ncbi:MAG TPA: M14 family metallopeptidase [Rhodothermales bacterium]|nr:M14 family metallopeptidase [Rhodothermales bacterium]